MIKAKLEFSTIINFVHWIYCIVFLFPLYVIIRNHIVTFDYGILFDALSLAMLYLILCYLVSYLKIYNDKLEIVYLFRIIGRVKSVDYLNIEKVRYLNYTHANQIPTIQILVKGYKTKLDLPSNSFPVFSYSKRKKILKYFAMKGISIEIVSERKKDLSILD
jgi:hypothetical protein